MNSIELNQVNKYFGSHIVGAFWLAAKLFRVGILMTGKPPGPLEILSVLRAPVTGISNTSQ